MLRMTEPPSVDRDAPTAVEVTIDSGEEPVRTLGIEVEGVLWIGRTEACQVRLDSDLVSRRHASVTLERESMLVEDRSSNGTMVGDIVLRSQARSVPYQTPIVVGRNKVVIRPLPRTSTTQSRSDSALRREIHRRLLDFVDLAKMDATKLDDPSMRPKVLAA